MMLFVLCRPLERQHEGTKARQRPRRSSGTARNLGIAIDSGPPQSSSQGCGLAGSTVSHAVLRTAGAGPEIVLDGEKTIDSVIDKPVDSRSSRLPFDPQAAALGLPVSEALTAAHEEVVPLPHWNVILVEHPALLDAPGAR